jgi:hypothetical protein
MTPHSLHHLTYLSDAELDEHARTLTSALANAVSPDEIRDELSQVYREQDRRLRAAGQLTIEEA